MPNGRRNHKPSIERAGAVAIPYYRERWRDKKRRRTYTRFAIIYSDGLRRHRERHADLATARARAAEIANAIANGEISMLQFGQADRAAWLRVREMLAPWHLAPEMAAGILVETLRSLGISPGPGTDLSLLPTAGRFYRQHHPAGASPKACAAILTEMLAARKKDGAAKNTIDDLESRLGRFCKDFCGPLLAITAGDLNAWLRSLHVSRRTRNNYRGNLVDLYRFARQAGYVPKAWAPLDDVPRVKNDPVKIEIFTPEEAIKLLAAARARDLRHAKNKPITPYLATAFFAGVRHEEMSAEKGIDGKPLPLLDWREIDFEAGEIRVLPEVARKIGRDRILPMQPNLSAWLELYRRANGRLCTLANVTNVLAELAVSAGLRWKDNGPRKSFISYRLAESQNIGVVASEAGTSPDRIRHNYKKTVPPREAARWFNIFPTQAEILQLPLRFGR